MSIISRLLHASRQQAPLTGAKEQSCPSLAVHWVEGKWKEPGLMSSNTPSTIDFPWRNTASQMLLSSDCLNLLPHRHPSKSRKHSQLILGVCFQKSFSFWIPRKGVPPLSYQSISHWMPSCLLSRDPNIHSKPAEQNLSQSVCKAVLYNCPFNSKCAWTGCDLVFMPS